MTEVNRDKICKNEFIYSMNLTVVVDLMIVDLVGGLWNPTDQALIRTRTLTSRMHGSKRNATQLPVMSGTKGNPDQSTICRYLEHLLTSSVR